MRKKFWHLWRKLQVHVLLFNIFLIHHSQLLLHPSGLVQSIVEDVVDHVVDVDVQGALGQLVHLLRPQLGCNRDETLLPIAFKRRNTRTAREECSCRKRFTSFGENILRIVPAIQRLPTWETSQPCSKSRQKKLLSHSSHFWHKFCFHFQNSILDDILGSRKKWDHLNRLDWIEVFPSEKNFFLLWRLVHW